MFGLVFTSFWDAQEKDRTSSQLLAVRESLDTARTQFSQCEQSSAVGFSTLVFALFLILVFGCRYGQRFPGVFRASTTSVETQTELDLEDGRTSSSSAPERSLSRRSAEWVGLRETGSDGYRRGGQGRGTLK